MCPHLQQGCPQQRLNSLQSIPGQCQPWLPPYMCKPPRKHHYHSPHTLVEGTQTWSELAKHPPNRVCSPWHVHNPTATRSLQQDADSPPEALHVSQTLFCNNDDEKKCGWILAHLHWPPSQALELLETFPKNRHWRYHPVLSELRSSIESSPAFDL